MTSDPSSADSTGTDASRLDGPGSLDDLYRQYIGEPKRQRDVSVGFGLFFAGLALGAIGLFMFLYSGTQPNGSAQFWQFRELGVVAGLTGLPAFILSIVVLLPVDRRAVVASGLGSVLCLAAVGSFVTTYPYQWTTQATVDGSVWTVVTYAAGLVVLTASTGAALVAEYLNREAGVRTETASSGEPSGEGGESVSDEQVEADIEEAMSDTDLSWGGVNKQEQTERLSLEMPDIDADQQSGVDETTATTTRARSDDVDSAVDNLQKLQGGERDTARGSSTEDQVNALTEFRKQQAEDDSDGLETGVEEREWLLEQLRSRLFG